MALVTMIHAGSVVDFTLLDHLGPFKGSIFIFLPSPDRQYLPKNDFSTSPLSP
jgi:hypothetical protein